MDIRMPRIDGLAATRLILAEPDPPKVAVLTTLPRGRVRLCRPPGRGQRVPAQVHPAVTRRLITEYIASRTHPRSDAALRRLDILSERERDVLILISRGLSNSEAARTLLMSEATIKTYVSRMLTKLGVANRTQAAILGHEAGLFRALTRYVDT